MPHEDRQILLPGRDDEELELRETPTSAQSAANSYHDDAGTNRGEPVGGPSFLVYLSACVAAIGGVLFGYDMGVISGAKRQMQADLRLSCFQLGWVVAVLPLGGFFASLVGGIAVDRYGRKVTIMANAMLFTVGALIVASTSDVLILLGGRFILGFAVSLSAIAECIYISEISTPEKRGMLVSLNELGITVGILTSFLVNYIFADTQGGWRYMFGMSSFAAVIQGVAMMFLPKTPRFLMLSKQEIRAEKTLRQLNLTSNVRQTLADIRHSLDEETSANSGFCSVVCSNADNMLGRLFIGCGLVFFQQFTGQPNAIYFAADIFRQVGFCTEWSSTLATVALGVMKVAATIVSLGIVDRIGRRKALVSGISVMMVSLAVLAVFAFCNSHAGSLLGNESTCNELAGNATATNTGDVTAHCSAAYSTVAQHWRYVALVALITFVCAFSFSFGPISWVILSEIFPASTKGRAMALATAFNWLSNSFVSATFLGATGTFTLGGVFLFYALMCGLAIIFVLLIVPETKNRSLEDISKDLRSKTARSLIRGNMGWCSCCGINDPSRPPRARDAYDLYSPLATTA